jgi:hypothetical protein
MRILLPYHGGVVANCFYQEFHRAIGEALQELGHEPVALLFAAIGTPAPAEVQAPYAMLKDKRVEAVLDLACWGYGLASAAVRRLIPISAIPPRFDGCSLGAARRRDFFPSGRSSRE